MPHRIIHKLQTLMVQDLPALSHPEVVLGEKDSPELADAVLDLLDEIRDGARSVFGFDRPTARQEHMMKTAGFEVLYSAGVIVTARGRVRYKE